jgi:hypothetical protein
MSSNETHTRTINTALAILGSKDRLAAALRIPVEKLEDHLAGEALSDELFLALLDFVGKGQARA